MDTHYTEGRKYSHISNMWILESSWNDKEEIERLRTELAEAQQGWISVDERLPEFVIYSDKPMEVDGVKIPALYRSERVTYLAEGVVFVGRLERVRETVMPSGITHWQPLPSPPQAINKDKVGE